MHCFGLGYALGWSDSDTMMLSQAVSLILVSVFLSLRILGFDHYYLKPFSSAITVLGSHILYLSGLIMGYEYYDYRDHRATYIQRNTQMFMTLLAGGLFGSVFMLDGLRNTAITYFILFCF